MLPSYLNKYVSLKYYSVRSKLELDKTKGKLDFFSKKKQMYFR